MSKSVRLSKHIKERLKVRLLDNAFKPKMDANRAAFRALGDDIYNDLYPEKVRKQMEAMPDGFLPTDSDVSVSFEQVDRYTRAYWNGQRRIASKHHNRHAAKVYEEKHDFTQRYAKLKEEREALRNQRAEAERSATAVMDNVTTLKKLIEVWPEVEPFARDFLVSAQSGTLPALPIGDLNKRLGLEK